MVYFDDRLKPCTSEKPEVWTGKGTPVTFSPTKTRLVEGMSPGGPELGTARGVIDERDGGSTVSTEVNVLMTSGKEFLENKEIEGCDNEATTTGQGSHGEVAQQSRNTPAQVAAYLSPALRRNPRRKHEKPQRYP